MVVAVIVYKEDALAILVVSCYETPGMPKAIAWKSREGSRVLFVCPQGD
jgi:hypothetical protein